MEHELGIVLTLASALTAALLLGLLAHKLRLSPIVGYLLAGVVVGPFTPGLTVHTGIASQFAELGVILIMFGVGLNLHVRELLAVKSVALPGAVGGIAAATGAGFLTARAFGWDLGASLLYGLALAAASTVVLLRIFADRDLLQTPAGHVAVGWLLVEDLFVVLVVVLVPLFAGRSASASVGQLASSVAIALGKLAGLLIVTWLVGRRVIPLLLGVVARTRSRELFTLAVLVLTLGLALGSAELFGASMALGAFLAGLVVGQTDFGSRAASEALPMRDAFAVVFFVATGMLLDPTKIAESLPLTLATLGAIWIAKPLVALVVMLALRRSASTATHVALGLGQIGEFSFVVASLGAQLGILPARASQSLVAASVVSITVNPLLLGLAAPISRALGRWLRPKGEARELVPPAKEPGYRVIVVGYGPVGQSLTRLLSENGLEPTVVELNHETVASLRVRGIEAVYGDASQREILERAGVATAGSLICTSSSPPGAVIQMAKHLNPALVVLSRANYLRDVPALTLAGATEVVSAEGEVALAMVERLVTRLGATGEQLDRERDRVRREVAAMTSGTEPPSTRSSGRVP
ncbi:MAG TPA: cation:proton antiporter [Polyangiaceae bacterium]|nr:cation:proton antiporter [Polyangiaceae bacterium]